MALWRRHFRRRPRCPEPDEPWLAGDRQTKRGVAKPPNPEQKGVVWSQFVV